LDFQGKNMKKKTVAMSAAILSIAATSTMADTCPNNFRETAVTGTVTTTNISETMQLGSIEMQLTGVKQGKVRFDERGAIVGRITGQTQDIYGRPVTILNHTIVFEDGSTIETSGDEATLNGYPDESGNIPVTEIISNFWGTGAFKRASGTIHADGSINVYGGQNEFVLSGTVCLKN
jgi:hypothetical protein